MSAKVIIHINGHDIDAASGEKINRDKSSATEQVKHRSDVVRRSKPTHIHHEAHKSTTLLRSAVKKPRILSDIRHVEVVEQATHETNLHHAHEQTHQSPKVVHFSKIEPRMIDTSGVEPTLSLPDGPPPILHQIRRSKAEDHIKRQLSAADAHHARPLKRRTHTKKRHRTSSMAAGIAAMVLVAGFIAYQSIPGLSLNLASRQAGFSAMLPKYTPGGFRMNGRVEYSQGRVVLSFKSNTDDRSYEIEQKPSLLTDTELQDQISENTDGKYQYFKDDGQAIFISADSASWVKRGVQFSLKGESGLSSSQIASIATSL